MAQAPRDLQLVSPRPVRVPLGDRVRAKIAAQRTIAVAPPPGTCLTVSVEQAAELLGISRDAAYAAVRQGQIPKLTFKRKIVVPMQGLLDLIEAASAATTQGVDSSCPSNRRPTGPKMAP